MLYYVINSDKEVKDLTPPPPHTLAFYMSTRATYGHKRVGVYTRVFMRSRLKITVTWSQ